MTESQADAPRRGPEPRAASGARGSASSRTWLVLSTLIPAIAVALVYAQVLDHGFVWDDLQLSRARVYADCDFKAIFTTAANGFEYLPVRDLTLCVDHKLSGNRAGGFHIQNVLLFMLACMLLTHLYRRLLAASPNPAHARNAPALALVCTLIFALHPLQVEPVAFITARNALLALVFVLATLVSYQRWLHTKRVAFYALSVVFVALALFSKATALPAALLVVLLNFYLSRSDGVVRSVVLAAPHLGVTVAAAALHIAIASTHGAMNSALSIGGLLERVPRAGFVPQFYLYKFVWPLNQSVEYVLTGVRENILAFGVGAVLLGAGCVVVLFYGFRVRALLAFFCAGFLLALLPLLNFFPTYPPVADRYAQIPLVFLVPLLVLPVWAYIPLKAQLPTVIPVAALLAYLSFQQVPVWKSDESIFAHAVATDPRALVSLSSLGHVRWDRGKEELALDAFERLGEQRPGAWEHALFQAWHAVRAGELDRAEKHLATAREKKVVPYYGHMVQAAIHLKRGEKKKAEREYELARADAEKRFHRDSRARVYLRRIKLKLQEFAR